MVKIQATRGEVVSMVRRDLPNIQYDEAILAIRDAYKKKAEEVRCWREKFCAETANVEGVKTILGPSYAHIRVDTLRYIIQNCAKNPELYGGGWSGTPNGHGATKGKKNKERLDRQHKYRARLRERGMEWEDLARKCKERDGYRCRLCNSHNQLEAHHRTYTTWKTPEEINDLTTLCRQCHDKVSNWDSVPQ